MLAASQKHRTDHKNHELEGCRDNLHCHGLCASHFGGPEKGRSMLQCFGGVEGRLLTLFQLREGETGETPVDLERSNVILQAP